MPPVRTTRHGASQASARQEKTIEAAVEFASKLKTLLSGPDDPSDTPLAGPLAADVARHVDRLHLCCQQTANYVPGLSGDPEIDRLATDLWNVCTRLGRAACAGLTRARAAGNRCGLGEEGLEQPGRNGQEGGSGGGNGDETGERGEHEPLPSLPVGNSRKEPDKKAAGMGRVYLYGRVLSFYLLAVARPRQNGRVAVVVRLMKLCLKAVRDCINAGETKLAGTVVQMAADYKGWLQDMLDSLPEEEATECRCLEVEYFLMRTALSWAENRLDVAEHMYTKAERLRQFLTPEYAERLADVLYEIGKSLSTQGDFKIAVKWFERANDVINDQELEHLSREGVELRLAILQALVNAHLGGGTPEGLKKAKNYVNFLESEAGNKFIVSLLKLELLQKSPAEVFDSEAYADVLRHIIRNFTFSEAGFKLVMHHIRKLHDKSPGAGCAVLDDFIAALSRAEKDGWLEKAVVTRMWMITNQRDSVETISATQGVLGYLSRPLSAEAAVAAQALLWKKIESDYSQGQYDLAESWCQLALHSVFRNCGPGNTSKLKRKLLLCALARNSLDNAASIIQNLSPQSLEEPMTAYLGFKVAIRAEDRTLAEKCLEVVAQAPDHVDYLGACIAESQKAGDIMCAIAALRKLWEKYEYKEPNPIHLPALFRCTIRLLNMLADRPGMDAQSIVNDLCEEFDAVVVALERQEKDGYAGRKLFTVDELEWFSRNAYNLALKNTSSWDLRCVVRMLTACVNILGHFPSDIGSRLELALKSLFSHFIIASALIALARTQDNVDKQLQDYSSVRKHVLAFDSELPEYLPQSDDQSRDDMIRKHATLLAFDFEAAVALKQWDDLGGIVQRAVPCKNITAFQAMADTLLRAHAPGQVLYSAMRKLVNEIWVLERFDAVKLAKYTRCLFQATLPLDDGLALRLLDEACSKARELRESQANWPEEELEWMATTAFNHAIDCYGAHELERAKEWAVKAIHLAHYCGDGSLEEILQSKYLRLSLDGESR